MRLGLFLWFFFFSFPLLASYLSTHTHKKKRLPWFCYDNDFGQERPSFIQPFLFPGPYPTYSPIFFNCTSTIICLGTIGCHGPRLFHQLLPRRKKINQIHPGYEGRLTFPEAFVSVSEKCGCLKVNQTGKSEYFLGKNKWDALHLWKLNALGRVLRQNPRHGQMLTNNNCPLSGPKLLTNLHFHSRHLWKNLLNQGQI